MRHPLTTPSPVRLRRAAVRDLTVYASHPFAFAALRNGNVQAIMQDGSKLVGLLAKVPDKENYEVPAFSISNDYIGAGIPKGETRPRAVVDETLRELEASGKAAAIYDRWFGPNTTQPLPRLFRIGDHS